MLNKWAIGWIDPTDMLDEEPDVQRWLSKIKGLYAKHGSDKYRSEEPGLRTYLHLLKSKSVLPDQYKLVEPLDVGGSSVVFRAMHSGLAQEFVVKFNRPIPHAAEMVENELETLPKMNSANIVRLVERNSTAAASGFPKLSYLIEPFLDGIVDLQLFFESATSDPSSVEGEHDRRARTKDLLDNFLRLLHQWVHCLRYIHAQGYVYLDVKPKNAVVDKDGHLFLIDFGTVQKVDPADNSPINVFFTGTFAGQWLLDNRGDEPSPGRLGASVKRSDLKQKFDYIALGKSIIYLLRMIEKAFPSDSPQLPVFRALHFIGTRLLDGENEKKPFPRILEKGRTDIRETFPGLFPEDYSTLKYESLGDVLRDIEKETGAWNPGLEIPELEPNAKSVLRMVPGVSTVLTSRVNRLIKHPLFARLKTVSELGLITLVYPTADHSRYDHILGSFTYTAQYIVSLFNDRANPFFRNLVDDHDLRATLLASLIHDLGQYPLAHDLEEVHPQIFLHTQLSSSLIDDPTVNVDGDTLLDIIKDPEEGWNVDPSWLKQILGGQSKEASLLRYVRSPKDFKADMLSALIDGPIDADKADYIVRDSGRSGVPYGKQLDVERLLRVMTIAVQVAKPEGPSRGHIITVGVYQKGRASAESFGFARYLLYASVYWHHTSRILKSMLQYCATIALPIEVFKEPKGELASIIHEDLRNFVVGLRPPYLYQKTRIAHQKKPPDQKQESLSEEPPPLVTSTLSEYDLGSAKITRLREWDPRVSVTDGLMLEWIEKLPISVKEHAETQKVKKSDAIIVTNLVNGILARKLYKRVVTLPRDLSGPHWSTLLEGFTWREEVKMLEELSWPERLELCRTVQEQIQKWIGSEWDKIDTTGPLTSRSDIEKLFESNLVILIDIPEPLSKIGFSRSRPLLIVPELRSKTYYQEIHDPEEATQWRQSLESLMDSIAPIRVLCHPKIQPLLSKNMDDPRTNLVSLIHSYLKKAGKLPV